MAIETITTAIADVAGAVGEKPTEIVAAHEAALQLLGLDNNAVAYGTDLIVGAGAYRRLCADEASCAGSRFKVFASGPHPVRVWKPQGALRRGFRRARPLRSHDVRCLVPEDVLAMLPLSPDFPYLREQYARLAEVLYFDGMSDAELGEFLRYVRG